jgi:hypothetical protein
VTTWATASPRRPRFAPCTNEGAQFADWHRVLPVQFERGQRKDEVAAENRQHFHAVEGVVFIGIAQERQSSFKATKHVVPPHAVHFSFSHQMVAVKHHYFYGATSKVA